MQFLGLILFVVACGGLILTAFEWAVARVTPDEARVRTLERFILFGTIR